MDSPPKRITRSRAAAKTTESSTARTTKVMTAAAKAKTSAPSTAMASTKSASAKRKAKAEDPDEDDDDDEEEGAQAVNTGKRTATRGRPRKMPTPEAETTEAKPATVKPTRGRPPKKTSEQQQDSAPPAAPRGRGRPKKIVEPTTTTTTTTKDETEKTTRTRSTIVSRQGTTSTKTGVKKSVTFQDTDKENVEPESDGKQAPAKSGRGQPARRGRPPSSSTGRATRQTASSASAATAAQQQKKPLSPKKVTQVSRSRADPDSSEDELAGEKRQPSVKRMAKGPIKPPASVIPKELQPNPASAAEKDADSTIEVNTAVLGAGALSGTAMASPARRPPASPFKDSMKSPARRITTVPFPGSAAKSLQLPGAGDETGASPFKTSLLQSAAKRPPSPIKGLQLPSSTSPSKATQSTSLNLKSSMLQSPAKRAFPGLQPLKGPRNEETEDFSTSPAMKLFAVATPKASSLTEGARRPSDKLMDDDTEAEDDLEESTSTSIKSLSFPGRLSAVLPREDDPEIEEDVVDENVPEDAADNDLHVAESEVENPTLPVSQDVEDELDQINEADVAEAEDTGDNIDEMDVDEKTAMTLVTPAKAFNINYQLRPKDFDVCHDASDDEDDHSRHFAIHEDFASPSKDSRRDTMGLSSLADQLGAWSKASPAKDDLAEEQQPIVGETSEEAQNTLVVSDFFEEEISAQEDITLAEQATAEVDEPEVEDMEITEEDRELAQEANDMSMMQPEEASVLANSRAFDDSMSEASQEYGDENQVPIDPALLGPPTTVPPVTPVRPISRIFNTTTKVPLKPADNSTPGSMKRCFSASRVAPPRPAGIPRSATVISYSPTKSSRRSSGWAVDDELADDTDGPTTPGPITPTKSDIFSMVGTPARTPRRDINPQLLRGAVVFVDVHTSEGAEANGIFVELLTQMGARCLKNWTWNPDSPDAQGSSDRVGITHVVYKDGGKRTLEKVRKSQGLVQCVGVSWVLDCERENEWLDEGSYYIDTSNVPRGGGRRRKSMEPKALANMNGTLSTSTSNGSRSSAGRRASHASPHTPANRRESTLWMLSPSDGADADEDGDANQGEDEDGIDWSKILLTPVPKTPAPEAIARYAAEIALPETPSGDGIYDDSGEDDTVQQDLMLRTCPPKQQSRFASMGEGILSSNKDEHVERRLVAARRKSLQFAPKIGSPLARAWK